MSVRREVTAPLHRSSASSLGPARKIERRFRSRYSLKKSGAPALTLLEKERLSTCHSFILPEVYNEHLKYFCVWALLITHLITKGKNEVLKYDQQRSIPCTYHIR